MTTPAADPEALQAITATPISEVSPDLPDLPTRAIEGCVTITWPFSASKRLIAFVLAEHDFRKRRNKGQVRIEFHGSAGKAVDQAKIASGDSVRLSLDGAEWEEQGPQPGMTGEPLGWQLKFSRRVVLSLKRLDAADTEVLNIDGDEADDEPASTSNALADSIADFMNDAQDEPPAPRTPLMNISTKRLASTAFEEIEEYVSPAFLKRAKVSYGSLFEGGFDALEEESSRRSKKGRRKSRFSMPAATWRYSSRSPSASPEPSQGDEEETPSSDNDLPVPGIHFGKKVASKTPDREVTMVDESVQTKHTDLDSLHASQGDPANDSRDHHIQIPSSDQPVTQPPKDTSETLQERLKEPSATEWLSAPLAGHPTSANERLPLLSPLGQSFDFGLENTPLPPFDSIQDQPREIISSTIAQQPPTDITLNDNSGFAETAVQNEQSHGDSLGEHHSSDQILLIDETAHERSFFHDPPSVSSPASVGSQPPAEEQSQNVETIEILSSSPVQSPRALPYEAPSAPEMAWTQEEEGEGNDGSDQDVLYDDQYEDGDAEGSEIDEADWTHDATPNDDADVPGEDYDLRKYDDALEDDEEGNIDRDSLLSTDGEGNVVPANPEVISASSSDSQEGAALDVDDEEDNEAADLEESTGAADAVRHEIDAVVSEASVSDPEAEGEYGYEEEGSALEGTDEEGIDEEEAGYDSEEQEEEEEEEYESDDDEQMREDPKPQEPVFIDLLSDSEDEAGNEQTEEPTEEDQESHEHLEPEQDHQEVNEQMEKSAAAATLKPVTSVPASMPAPHEEHVEAEMSDEQHSSRDQVVTPVPEGPSLSKEVEPDVIMDDLVSAAKIPSETAQTCKVGDEAKAIAQESHRLAFPTSTSGQDEIAMLEDRRRDDHGAGVTTTNEDNKANQTTLQSDALPQTMSRDTNIPDVVTEESEAADSDKDATQNQAQSDKRAGDIASDAVLPHEGINVPQTQSSEPTYHTQPPMSFHDLGISQSSISSQTVAGSQLLSESLQPLDVPSVEAQHPSSEKADKVPAEKGIQQLITPSETQHAEPIEVEGDKGGSGHERSPGPDDQLYLEMEQHKGGTRASAIATASESAHAVTEEEELAAIEAEAEHDPTLEQKDYIITADSLRSHDQKDSDTFTDAVRKDNSQTPLAEEMGEPETAPEATSPKLQVPPRRSHRKTRSSGSVNFVSEQLGEDIGQDAETQQLDQETLASQDLEETKTQGNSRSLRRRKGMADLDIETAKTATVHTAEPTPMGLRSSPRGQRRTTSEVTTETFARSPVLTTSPKAEKPSSSKAQLLRMLQSDLPEFLPLKVLRNSLHKTVDILAIAAVTPSAPVRPKNGPRDYMLELILTDPSTAPSSVSVSQIYRPHQQSLPVVKAGDVVLLRRFQVLSMKGRGFGLRAGDDSAWAVFEQDDKEKLPQIMGPPVEVTEEEVVYVMALAGWWEGMGSEAWKKAEKAGEKAKLVTSGDGK